MVKDAKSRVARATVTSRREKKNGNAASAGVWKEGWKHNLAGHMTKPDAVKRVFFALDHHAARQNRRLLIADVHKLSGDRELSFQLPSNGVDIHVASSHYLSTRMTMSKDNEDIVPASSFPVAFVSGNVSPGRKSLIRTHFCNWHSLWMATQNQHCQRMMSVLQINVFHLYLPCWTDVLLLSSQFYIVHIHRQDKSFFSVNEQAFTKGNLLPYVF